MYLLKNFTIRIVMLAILGLCLLWSGVGLFSLHALSKISEGNDIDRHLVKQMTVLNQERSVLSLCDTPEPCCGCQNWW